MVTSLHFNQIPRSLAGDVLTLQYFIAIWSWGFINKLDAMMRRFSKRLLTIAARSRMAMPAFACGPAQPEACTKRDSHARPGA
jgi:hypothetical protein